MTLLSWATEHSGGGERIEIKDQPKIDLRNKYIVWWRAILGRPVEFIGQTRLPKTKAEVEQYLKDVVYPKDDHYEVITNLIPEYQDLKAKKQKSERDKQVLKSYHINMAVYNATKKEIETLYFDVLDELVDELSDTSRLKEVNDHLLKACKLNC